MEAIFVKGRFRNSKVLVGKGLANLASCIPKEDVYIITDSNVHHHHQPLFPEAPVYIMEAGEESKTIDIAKMIARWLMENGAGRDAFILGVGGGVVCDMAGFVASFYMRGVDFGFVATSLLAQIDASIGGKNGVNLDGYKNIIGAINQPAFVLCDTSLLSTLPDEEFKNGLAEAVKHSLIANRQMFNKLKSDTDAIMARDLELINQLVHQSVRVKAGIVSLDEVEQGERRKLNLGHTWGHAVEKTDKISHGKAVSIGLAFASGLSWKRGLIATKDHEEIIDLLASFGLPTKSNTKPEVIFKALIKDKKKEGAHVHFVWLHGIGDVQVEPISLKALKKLT